MSYSAHVDSFARDNLPPKEQWPAFLFTRPELQYPARLNACTRVSRPLDRGRPGRCALPRRPGRDPDLWRARPAGEPDRQRPHRQARARAGRPRAPARRQHADVGRGLLRGAEGRRRRRRDDADAAGARDRLPARQGEDRARALRSSLVGGAGEGASAGARPRARRLLGRRRTGQPRGADGRRLAALRGGRDRGRRRLPHRLHLRHHRRAEGHDAFPPRPRRDLRRLLGPRAASRAVRPLHRLAAARLHLRPRRAGAVPDACRRRRPC